MTRAVIELANEIDFAMSKLSKAIAGAAYNPKGKEMAFRINDYSVVIEGRRMIIVGADTEEKAKEIMRQLNRIYLKK